MSGAILDLVSISPAVELVTIHVRFHPNWQWGGEYQRMSDSGSFARCATCVLHIVGKRPRDGTLCFAASVIRCDHNKTRPQ